MMGIMRGFENRLKGQCGYFFSLVYLKRFLGTWKFMLVQKMIRRVHGMKILPELPNTDVYLLAQDAENPTKNYVLAVFLYFSVGDVLLTSVRQNSGLDCHLVLRGNFS